MSSGLYYKSFTIVMTVWDSDQYYKTPNYDPRVVIHDPSLSIIDDAWVVIYATIWSVIYDRKFTILNLL
jgi:hypothetical protein